MNDEHFEIERKFLILRPARDYLERYAEGTEITQTYLLAAPGETERVRRRGRDGRYVYTHTSKLKLSDLRRIEREEEITEAEYQALLERADPEARPIEKERWVLNYRGQSFEIDLFPFWQRQAYLELELENEDQEIAFPPEITILREVTDDPRYTNSALARTIPEEEASET